MQYVGLEVCNMRIWSVRYMGLEVCNIRVWKYAVCRFGSVQSPNPPVKLMMLFLCFFDSLMS